MRLLLAMSMFFSQIAMAATTVSVDSLMSTLIYLVVIALIFWLIWWFIGYVGVPEPFNKVIRVIVGILALIVLMSFLLSLIGYPVLTVK